ncbi:MAG: V-type ATPase subunit [Treponemataceae bacterium]
MRGAGQRAYVWAKACGIIGKTYLGARTSQLFPITRLAELDRLLFPSSPLELPERELSARLERRVSDRAASRTVGIVSSFKKPAAALVRLISAYEYADLARTLAAVAAGERNPPEVTDIGSFRTVHFEAYPDVAKMTFRTEFSWLAEKKVSPESLVEIETDLDRRYYYALWSEIVDLPRSDRNVFQELVSEEISLKNIVWALRLRVYYGIEGEDLARRLVDVKYKGHSLADDAIRIGDFALDRKEDWKNWKRRYLLNEEKPGEFWKIDPRRVQNAASRRLYSRARCLFRMNPSSLGAVACFAKLVQFEEDLLTSVAEGLCLGLSPRDVVAALEVSA